MDITSHFISTKLELFKPACDALPSELKDICFIYHSGAIQRELLRLEEKGFEEDY